MEEDSTRSLKTRRSEKELEKEDDKPIIEGHDSEDDSDELPDTQLQRTSYLNFQSFSGPPPSSHWEYTQKAHNNSLLTLIIEHN